MNNTSFCPLDHFGSLALSGQDARAFLQGQVTCDVDQVSSTQVQAGAYCTPKGNVIANFELLKQQDNLLMHMPMSMVTTVHKALAKYIVFSKAELVDVSSQWARFAVWGQAAAACVAQLAPAPSVRHQASAFAEGFIWASNTAADEFIVYCQQEDAAKITSLLQTQAQLTDQEQWQAVQISQGTAYVTPEISDSYVPQMLNLQATGAINFNKGCYTGQEIVARMQYLGKLKRHLFIGQVTSSQALEIGQQIDASKRKNVGRIVSCAHTGDSTYAFTAVINCTEAVEGQLHLHEQEDASITIMPLPYEIDPQVFERIKL